MKGVKKMVYDTIYFLDTFSTGVLSSGYNWFNEVVPPEGPPPTTINIH